MHHVFTDKFYDLPVDSSGAHVVEVDAGEFTGGGVGVVLAPLPEVVGREQFVCGLVTDARSPHSLSAQVQHGLDVSSIVHVPNPDARVEFPDCE